MNVYARVMRTVQVDGMTVRNAAREFGLSRKTVAEDADVTGTAGVSAGQTDPAA